MHGDPDETSDLLSHVLLPVADETDALATARALEPYRPGRITVVHVVEKGEGVPDKTPVEQSEELADKAYAAVRSVFPDADDRTAYARDVVAEIGAVAESVGASAVVYRPRTASRLMQFLSGDRSLRLITETDRPVVALPRQGTDG
jgi:hypothetical protein